MFVFVLNVFAIHVSDNYSKLSKNRKMFYLPVISMFVSLSDYKYFLNNFNIKLYCLHEYMFIVDTL